MRLVIAALVCLSSTLVCAKLPPPTEEAKAKAAEANAKSAWSDKVGLYQLCVSMDRTAAAYRKTTKAAGKPVPAVVAMPPCAHPGDYVSTVTPVTPAASKPLEAAGAHSPPGTAVSPPSGKSSASEIASAVKK